MSPSLTPRRDPKLGSALLTLGFLAASLLSAAPATAWHAPYRTVSESYAWTLPGEASAAVIENQTAGQRPLFVGGVVFKIFPEEQYGSLQFTDESSIHRLVWLDSAGEILRSARYCRHAEILVHPVTGRTTSEVWVLPSPTSTNCFGGDGRHDTRGTVTAQFSHSTHASAGNPLGLPSNGWFQGVTRFNACALVLADSPAMGDDKTRKVCHASDASQAGAPPGFPTLLFVDFCDGVLDGVVLTVLGQRVTACASAEVDPPTTTQPQAKTSAQNSTPGTEAGLTVEWLGGSLGGCFSSGVRTPSGPCGLPSTCCTIFPLLGPASCANVSLTACGEQAPVDPTLYFLGNGAVWFCGAVQTQPPNEFPPVDVDTDPCDVQTVDPTVHVGDGHAQVCLFVAFGPHTSWLSQLFALQWCPGSRPGGATLLGVGTQTCIE